MPPPADLPSFTRFPFTREEALAAGISDTVLRGKRLRRLFAGVYVLASTPMTFALWLTAAVLAMPRGSVVSHVTALRLYGFEVGEERPFHLSTRSATHTRRAGITAHQRLGQIHSTQLVGVPVTRPDRTVVDIATKVSLLELVQAIEFMLHRGHTTLDALTEYALTRHLDGVRRTRRVLPLVREGVESPMETLVRLMIVFARLPEPAPNLDIRDRTGRFIARGDLVYSAQLVLVEYDGWHHERDAWQRRRDIVRRETLEAAGWRVIVVTSADLRTPHSVVRRVHAALAQRGYTGPGPVFNAMWTTWFVPGRAENVGGFASAQARS